MSFQRQQERHSLFEHQEDVRILESGRYVDVMEHGFFATAVVLQDRFRSVSDQSILLPFLMDTSKVVSSCPNLRRFILRLGNGCYLLARSVPWIIQGS